MHDESKHPSHLSFKRTADVCNRLYRRLGNSSAKVRYGYSNNINCGYESTFDC